MRLQTSHPHSTSKLLISTTTSKLFTTTDLHFKTACLNCSSYELRQLFLIPQLLRSKYMPAKKAKIIFA